MNRDTELQAAIYIDEEHDYDVDLGVVSVVTWREAHGSVRVEIPYDGALFKQEDIAANSHPVGNLQITYAGESETLPIALQAGAYWQRNLKSNKKHVVTAEYEIFEPGDPLISIDGVVLDALDEDIQPGNEGIFGDLEAYNNPLALRLSFWVPDLLAEARPSELYELEAMLLRGENTQLVFMPGPVGLNFEQKLAENMVALTNTAGGVILLGVDRNGHITGVQFDAETRRFLLTTLLRAALRSSPPVPISWIRHIPERRVVRIEIPKTNLTVHRINGVIFKREGRIISEEASVTPTAVSPNEISPAQSSSLESIFDRDEAGTISFRNREDVVVHNGSNGFKRLRIGADICGLINAGRRNGRIIITDLPDAQTDRSNIWLRAADQSLEEVISNEMSRLLPKLEMPRIETHQLGNRKIAIIYLPAWQFPIALYDNEAYLWQNLVRNELNVDDLFEKYLAFTSGQGQSSDNQDVYLEQATLGNPLRPPERLEKTTSIEVRERLVYDVEYQAQVWQPRPFKPDKDTVGFSLQLTAPLLHASLGLAENGQIITKSPQANGRIRVRLKDILVSGLDVSLQADGKNSWFETIPIIKRTYLNLTYNARLNELFRRRTKNSLLRFLIPDVLLDRERVEDLAQVCADEGFRVYDKELFETASTSSAKATIQGIRSSGFYDIGLQIGLLCQRSELTRELIYDGWRDSKPTPTSLLDIRVRLWGTGDQVEKEIGHLQMALYQTISQRLQHLRAE